MQPHEVLGVRPGASLSEVTAAFRRFALCHHPDRGGDPTRFRAGVDAYRCLVGPRLSSWSSPRRAEVVFHRRKRPGIPPLLRLAGRRLAASRPRP
ncbi:MAG: DnaJ domain-containing protein [Acidimicrobiales bacterium]